MASNSSLALLVTVRFLDGRYHGAGDWPPSPFRVYQALVAGVLIGQPRSRADEVAAAFGWLETLDPPVIAAPAKGPGREYRLFVPNNDSDTIGGDPARVAKIRSTKLVAPRILKSDAALHYLWQFGEAHRDHAATVAALAKRIYQLGRGVDMAFATGEVLPPSAAQERLTAYHGSIHRPSAQGVGGVTLRSPTRGSFHSLRHRHRAMSARQLGGHLHQVSPPRFRLRRYDARPHRLLFDIMRSGDDSFRPVPLTRTAGLAEQVRDLLAEGLAGFVDRKVIERVVIGRAAGEVEKALRLRIVPLPSIGFEHADRAIRRVLIEVPPDCPISVREIEWAAGMVQLTMGDARDASAHDHSQLLRAADRAMLTHYGIGDAGVAVARVWRTVTPAVLSVPGRRLQPEGGREAREAAAGHATRQAARHAGISAPIEAVRVQREPFDPRGTATKDFLVPSRFACRNLHHAEITFRHSCAGPIVIGDGRYLGLGLMQPVRDSFPGLLALTVVSPMVAVARAPQIVRAVRRALMAVSRDDHGNVPRLFSGHESDGSPARSGRHEHVFIAGDDADGDARIDRIVAAAPWICDRTAIASAADRKRFHEAVSAIATVRAGALGIIRLNSARPLVADDPLLGPSRLWASRTPYSPTRLAGLRKDARQTVALDLVEECQRRGFPRPHVDVLSLTGNPSGRGIVAHARLRFNVSVNGPLLLGYESHLGAGLFGAVE